jgi:ATP-dependent Clp endopeptidase proteolytic subunit ClpP
MKKTINAALLSRVNAIVDKRAARAVVARGGDNSEPRKWFNFTAKSDDESTLYIYDEISSWWGIGANEFVTALNEVDSKTLNIHLNSPGGSVFEGFAIYAAIIDFAENKKAKVNMIVDGWAASIASVIMCAGDRIKVGEHASVMIHEPWGFAIGSADEMREEAEVLDMLEETIIDIYVSRTKGDRNQIQDWVKAETWFKGQAAVDAGFADEVIPLKKKGNDEEDKAAKPAASHDAEYFAAIFPNMPSDVREALTKQSMASNDTKELPKTEREFSKFLQSNGFSRDGADRIAGHGFKSKTEPRDVADRIENPTTAEPRDVAEKRDDAAEAIRAVATAVAIRAAARKSTFK